MYMWLSTLNSEPPAAPRAPEHATQEGRSLV